MSVWADVVLVIHIAYVAAVVLGLVAIWVGWFYRAGWVHNPWIRGGHLAMIGVVVAESWLGITCPLTTWEWQLRFAAGQSPSDAGPLVPWLHPLLFFDAEWWVFTACYTTFGLLVLLSIVVIPPKLTPSRDT